MPGAINFFIVFLLGKTVMVKSYTERPTLRLEPEHPVYIVGETLSLRCVAADPSTSITGYRFYKDAMLVSNNSVSNILRISSLSITDAGNYFCSYDQETVGRKLESIYKDLKILEGTPAPTLSVEPQRNVFVVKQSVAIRCLIPGQTIATEINFYKNGTIIYEPNHLGVLSLANTEKRNTGSYTCRYKILLSERTVDSHLSNRATLVVIDLPPTPVLRYAYSLQNQREVEIVCEIPNPSSSIHGNHLYRNGGEISSSQADRFVMNYSLEFDGCYFCRSFVDILGEKILSNKSDEVFLTLEERDRRSCQAQNSENLYGLSKEGVKLYGSVLIGKLIVLISILLTFGIYLLVIRLRSKKSETEEQSFHR